MDRVCNIYRILNLVTKKSYIGSTVHLKSRWRDHQKELEKGIHLNTKLQASYNLYGKSAFIYGVLTECLESVRNFQEAFYMEKYDSIKNGYNLTKIDLLTGGFKHSKEICEKIGSTGRGRKMSLEARRKISMARLGKFGVTPTAETNRKRSEALKGHAVSESTRKRISETQMGNTHCLGREISRETRDKISKGNTGKVRSEELKRQHSETQTGYRHTEEAKAKIRAARARQVIPKGRKISEEARKKQAESMRRFWQIKRGY